MRSPFRILVASCTLGLALAACNGTPPTTQSSLANPAYVLKQTLAVPGVPPPTGTWSFDIGITDSAARRYFVADRTNNGVDVVDTSANKFLFTAGQGAFTGSAGIPGQPNTAGPDGIVEVPGNLIFAGDGNSTLKVVSAAAPGPPVANIVVNNPVTVAPAGMACPSGSAVPSAGVTNHRVDEGAFDPTDNEVLFINDDACPPFGTFVSASAPFTIKGQVSFTNANGGVEQPTWDPTQHKFLVAVPGTTTNPGGEVDVIDPVTFAITATFPTSNNCQPNGSALGPNETLFLGCSNVNGPLIAINATTGATVFTVGGFGGGDEVWYNPTANRFYCACSNNANITGPALVVVDASSGAGLQAIPTSGGAHSVAVDSTSDTIYMPQRQAPATIGLSVFSH